MVEKLQGKNLQSYVHSNAMNLDELKRWLMENEDDEFFYLTCHVDPALRSKITEGGGLWI